MFLNVVTSLLTQRIRIIWVVTNLIDGVRTGSPASPFLKKSMVAMNCIELLGGK